MKVNSLKRNHPSYPELLHNITGAPDELFYKGASPSEWLSKPRVAIVGSRKVTAYGKDVTERLARGLAEHGVVIISGLAYGVDAIAHREALASSGITVAVLPTSLNKIYPASHTNLARQITEAGGTLISEYEPGAPTLKYQFTARNRIVSGLADIVLITEAAAASGTMNTARYALEQGKVVMAVPGNITSPTSEGTNNLIKSGALPVTCVDDILFELKINPAQKSVRKFSGTPEEKMVLKLIKKGVASQEELAVVMRIDGSQISSLLTMLEIQGFIKPLGGGFWTAS